MLKKKANINNKTLNNILHSIKKFEFKSFRTSVIIKQKEIIRIRPSKEFFWKSFSLCFVKNKNLLFQKENCTVQDIFSYSIDFFLSEKERKKLFFCASLNEIGSLGL